MPSKKTVRAIAVSLLEEHGYETTIRILHRLKAVSGSTALLDEDEETLQVLRRLKEVSGNNLNKMIQALLKKVDDLETIVAFFTGLDELGEEERIQFMNDFTKRHGRVATNKTATLGLAELRRLQGRMQ